jgi:hypothetical protein
VLEDPFQEQSGPIFIVFTFCDPHRLEPRLVKRTVRVVWAFEKRMRKVNWIRKVRNDGDEYRYYLGVE